MEIEYSDKIYVYLDSQTYTFLNSSVFMKALYYLLT